MVCIVAAGAGKAGAHGHDDCVSAAHEFTAQEIETVAALQARVAGLLAVIHQHQRKGTRSGRAEDRGFQHVAVCAGHHDYLFVQPRVQHSILRLRLRQAGQREAAGNGNTGDEAGEAGKHGGTPELLRKPEFDSKNQVS